MWSALPIKPVRMLFCLKRSLAALTLNIFLPPVQNFYPAVSLICYSCNPSHPIPRSRGIGKGENVCSEVREGVSALSVWSSSQTASSILPYTLANPWRPNCHVQDYPWSPGIPRGVHLRIANPQRATRPRLKFSPTEMLYPVSPIRLHNSGCPILEQTAGWNSPRTLGEIFQDTSGCPLAVPVPRSTHWSTHPPPLQPESVNRLHPRQIYWLRVNTSGHTISKRVHTVCLFAPRSTDAVSNNGKYIPLQNMYSVAWTLYRSNLFAGSEGRFG